MLHRLLDEAAATYDLRLARFFLPWPRQGSGTPLGVTAIKTSPQYNVKPKLEPQGINQVPSEISRIADAAGMGRLLHAQNAMTPAKSFLVGLAIGIAAIGATYALGWYANLQKISGDHEAASDIAKVALVTFLAGVFFVLTAIRSMFDGRRSAYLYDNGVVWRRNRRIEPVPWSRMTELVRWRVGGDNMLTGVVTHYVLVTVDGTRLVIDKFDANGETSFSTRFEETMRQRGGRVVNGGSYVQLGPPILPLPGLFIWLLLIGCLLAVWGVLDKLKMPDGMMAPLAPLLVGLTVLAIELRTGRPIGPTSVAWHAPFGTFLTVIGGLLLAWSAGFFVDKMLGWAVLGIEIVIAFFAVKLMNAYASKPR